MNQKIKVSIVRITDIHPRDSFYPRRDEIIGELVALNMVEPSELFDGWMQCDGIIPMITGDLHFVDFLAFKCEEVK